MIFIFLRPTCLTVRCTLCAARYRQCFLSSAPRALGGPMDVRPSWERAYGPQLGVITRELTSSAMRRSTTRDPTDSTSLDQNGRAGRVRVLRANGKRRFLSTINRAQRCGLDQVGGPLWRWRTSRGRPGVCSFQVPADFLCDARLRS